MIGGVFILYLVAFKFLPSKITMELNEGIRNGVHAEEKTERIDNTAESDTKIPLAEEKGSSDVDAENYDPPFKFNYGPFDVCCVIFSLITYVGDQVTDILVAVYFFSREKYWYFALTLTFIVVPAFTMTVFSFTWYIQDYKLEKRPPATRCQWVLRAICLLFHVGPILRYFESLIYGYQSKKHKAKKKDYFYLMIYEDTDAGFLRLFECFMESAPQLVLQIYILAKNDIPENVENDWKIGLQIVSVTSSLLSLSWALASYNRSLRFSLEEKMKMTWMGTFFQFFWHFFGISSRVLALALFASVYPYYIFVFIFLHWSLMTGWIYLQKTSFCNRPWEEFFFDLVMGIIYIFCYFNVKDVPTRYKYTAYYIVILCEGTALMTVWFVFSDPYSWYHYPALIFFYSSFVMSLVFMIVYYYYFHPSMAYSVNKIAADAPDGPVGDYCTRQNSRLCTQKLGRVRTIAL